MHGPIVRQVAYEDAGNDQHTNCDQGRFEEAMFGQSGWVRELNTSLPLALESRAQTAAGRAVAECRRNCDQGCMSQLRSSAAAGPDCTARRCAAAIVQ